MGFNYAQEWRKFQKRWKKLRQEYEQAGMSPEIIAEIYLFDLDEFNSRRKYETRTQLLPDFYIAENLEDHSTLMKKFHTLSVSFDESDFPSRYSWVDAVEDPALSKRLKCLSDKDLELLTYLVIEGHEQSELARKWNCTQSAVAQRYKKIKKFLK